MKNKNAKQKKTGTVSRRDFLKQSSLAVVPLVMGSTLFSRALYAETIEKPHTLVFVFLRGGADALSILAPRKPLDRITYETSRPNIKIPVDNLLPLTTGPSIKSPLGLNDAASSLLPLYQHSELAFFMNVGCLNPTTSHFNQQDNIEYGFGATRDGSISGGFLNRALSGIPIEERSKSLPAVSIDKSLARSLQGREPAVAFDNLETQVSSQAEKDLSGGLKLSERLSAMFMLSEANVQNVDKMLRSIGHRADKAAKTMDEARKQGKPDPDGTVPHPIDISPPEDYSGSEGKAFGNAVRLMNQDPGLRFLTITVGGWDDHSNIGSSKDGAFAKRLKKFSDNLATFVKDLKSNDLFDKTTIVVMSEFGRRIEENSSKGCDHGRGGFAMVIGAGIEQQVTAPDFNLENKEGDGNLPVSIDYREIFTEILEKKMKLTNVRRSPINIDVPLVFPDLSELKSKIKLFKVEKI